MTAMSIEDISSRISSIQSQLASMFAPATASADSADSADSTASTDPTASSDFSSTLGRAMTSTTGATSGQDVVSDAKKYLGIPYVWGGTDPSTGLDCSGLTQRVYQDLGVTLPRTAHQQQDVGTPVASMADAQPGDLLFYGDPAHHVVIYAGDGKIIEAPHTGENVREVPLSYDGTPTSIRRIVGSSLDPSTSASTGVTPRATTTALSPGTPYAADFAAASARTGVPVSMLTAVAKQESGFNANAVSKAGAEGLMQLMPGTAKSLGVTNPMDPAQSINGAADYLKTMLDKFGSVPLALAAYNAGPGAVLKYDGVPPYPETQSYVKNVIALMGSAS